MTVESTQCKVCTSDQEIKNDIHDLRSQGDSYRGIAGTLAEVGVSISPSSLKRHFDNHISANKSDKTNPKTEPKTEEFTEGSGHLGSVTTDLDGGEFKDIKTEEPITDWTFVFERFNLDPESFEIINNTVRMSSWQQSKRLEDGDRDVQTLYSYRALFRKKAPEVSNIELPALISTIKNRAEEIRFSKSTKEKLNYHDDDLAVITCFSDLQAGKSDHRGGTPELLNRVYSTLDGYEQYLDEVRPSTVVLADLGDIIEGFNSTASEMFTNDLSIMDQVDLAHTVVSEFLAVTAKYAKNVVAVAVPSNHAAWRKGKDYLGTPADDWGLYIFRMIEKEYKKYGMDKGIRFVYPNEHDKSVNVPVKGMNIGFVHGDDWSGGLKGSEAWWQKQQHGGGPTSRSDILVHGHYHTFDVRMSGRTPEKLQKWIISATTLDSGSSWFANGNGGTDSEAGLTVFGVRRGKGLDLSTLRILK